MAARKASIKESGEEISQADWQRFDAAVARAKAERAGTAHLRVEPDVFETRSASSPAKPGTGRRSS